MMTLWVVWQDTDFCTTLWEERLYNAIVGVIYCFCFFNLKEGRSRVRAFIFYCVIVAENLAFLAVFHLFSPDSFDVTVAGLAVILSGGFGVRRSEKRLS